MQNEPATGVVFNIQKFSLHDGPGIRTLVFLKTCPLHCQWCSNPEGISPNYEILFMQDKCVSCGRCLPVCPAGLHVLGPDHVHTVNRQRQCLGCGRCVEQCLVGALSVAGRAMTVDAVVTAVMEDQSFYASSGGGVTLSGGEAGMQGTFARAILERCRECGVHTAMETCGHVPWETFEALLPQLKLLLYDIKHIDPERHRELTGRSNELILANLSRLLAGDTPVVVRMPLIPGRNDDRETIEGALDFVARASAGHHALAGVDLLPYHRYGQLKYRQLGQAYRLSALAPHTPEQLEELTRLAAASPLPVRIVKH